jgi:hypothetical protein
MSVSQPNHAEAKKYGGNTYCKDPARVSQFASSEDRCDDAHNPRDRYADASQMAEDDGLILGQRPNEATKSWFAHL